MKEKYEKNKDRLLTQIVEKLKRKFGTDEEKAKLA